MLSVVFFSILFKNNMKAFLYRLQDIYLQLREKSVLFLLFILLTIANVIIVESAFVLNEDEKNFASMIKSGAYTPGMKYTYFKYDYLETDEVFQKIRRYEIINSFKKYFYVYFIHIIIYVFAVKSNFVLYYLEFFCWFNVMNIILYLFRLFDAYASWHLTFMISVLSISTIHLLIKKKETEG